MTHAASPTAAGGYLQADGSPATVKLDGVLVQFIAKSCTGMPGISSGFTFLNAGGDNPFAFSLRWFQR